MAARSGPPSSYFYRSSMMPEGVKWLLIINVALFVAYSVATLANAPGLFTPFGLIPGAVVFRGRIWQLFTYQFLHQPIAIGHILFNMLTLWMVGHQLENTWGRKRFLQYYFICGVGAGICVVLANLAFGTPNTMTIGASGAIYGLLLAFGMLFPDQVMLMNFLFPIKAKYFVMILGAIAFWYSITSPGGAVSNVAHLGGMVVGYFYLKSSLLNRDLWASLRHEYKEWKMRRAKKQFQVYMNKQRGNRDIQ